MEIKILYIGNDDSYWSKIQKRLLKDYESLEFLFEKMPIEDDFSVKETFISVYHKKAQIVYVDFSEEFKCCLQLTKLLNRNNETRLLALVGLFSSTQDQSYFEQAINATIRILHIKSDEMQDVTYDPISLLDVNLAEMPAYVSGKPIKDFEIMQPLRVGYIEDNFFHVETNSYLKEGSIVHISQHPLMHIMPSKKVYVSKFYDQGMYYNRRFAYDLEFIYIDDDFFTVTNERWRLYKELKQNPDKLEALSEIEKREILADIRERKKNYTPIKESIDEWLETRIGATYPKKLKIMIIDNTLTLFEKFKNQGDKFPYSLNFQTKLLFDNSQIKRSMPHLILFHVSEVNTFDTLKGIIASINKIENYDPFIIVTNSPETSDKVKEKLGYKYLMSFSKEIETDNIQSLAQKLDDKLHISDAGKKFFLRSNDPAATMYLYRKVKVVSFTESVMYIVSDIEIPLWTVFVVKQPVSFLLTVVPHKEGSEQANIENCYRCLINGTGEIQKAKIRQLLNSTLLEEKSKESE